MARAAKAPTFTDVVDMAQVATIQDVSLDHTVRIWRTETVKFLKALCRERGVDWSTIARDVAAQRDLVAAAGALLPSNALPIPDVMFGNRPGWFRSTIDQWAEQTDRRNEDGSPRRAGSGGRPPGVVETRPRERDYSRRGGATTNAA